MIDTRLSHYVIESELGRGGMGIVYKARDTKLDRTVAIKVLPASALSSEDDRTRFYREAKAAAQLHHPHIAAVFEIDEAVPEGGSEEEPRPFIAMEYIDGEPLADRIGRAPLKLDEARTLALQTAKALEAAHEKNIVHRDIKSANVMLTTKGEAKVLDFGLALTAQSTKLTRMGSTLGTVAYMSPEQARGEEVDHRTDLWALGVVLYEMITGRNPFGGDYEQAVVYSILNADPEPVTALRTGVPMELERIIDKLLSKELRHRYQSATDLIADLDRLDIKASGSASVRTMPAAATTATSPGANDFRKLAMAFGAGALLILLAWLAWPSPESDSPVVYRMDTLIPSPAEIGTVDISRDGKTLVYAVSTLEGGNVFVRDLTNGQTRRIPEAVGIQNVELSNDGQTILLTKQLSIERVSVNSGTPFEIVTTQEGNPRANWGPEGWILYEDNQEIWKISLQSGDKEPVIRRDSTAGEVDIDWPIMLPDGKTVMATVEYDGVRPAFVFADFETGERKGMIRGGGYRPQYAASGHIVSVLDAPVTAGNLVVTPFDLDTFEQSGSVIPVASNVSPNTLSISQNGTMVYGGDEQGAFNSVPISKLIIGRFPGLQYELPFPPAIYQTIELSPDEEQAVAAVADPQFVSNQGNETDVMVMDLDSGRSLMLSSGRTGGAPTWHPSGDSIVFANHTSKALAGASVEVKAADGSGSSRVLFHHPDNIFEMDMSEDGDRIVLISGGSQWGATEMFMWDRGTGQTSLLVGGTAAYRRSPKFSPDGSQVAYTEDGQIYLIPSDGRGLPSNFSTGAASNPIWTADGKALFYFGADASIYRGGIGAPSNELMMQLKITRQTLDVFSSGDRVLLPSPDLAAGIQSEGSEVTQTDSLHFLTFTINWFEELK